MKQKLDLLLYGHVYTYFDGVMRAGVLKEQDGTYYITVRNGQFLIRFYVDSVWSVHNNDIQLWRNVIIGE